jgi:hypothetical protein
MFELPLPAVPVGQTLSNPAPRRRSAMQSIVIEEPYEFVPPLKSRFWPPIIRRFFIPPFLRRTHGVHSIETRNADRLQASLAAGKGVMLAPNHCRMSDPLTFGPLTEAIGRNMYAMA